MPIAIGEQIAHGNVSSPVIILRSKGWAGAALWYNRISEQNGSLMTAIMSMPQSTQYPFILEVTARQRVNQNQNLKAGELFNPTLANGEVLKFSRPFDSEMLAPLYYSYQVWNKDKTNAL
jgi:hypothetical protein